MLEQLEQRAVELEADNDHQRQRIGELEAEARELTDTLEAARVVNRDLMSELNRVKAHPADRDHASPSR